MSEFSTPLPSGLRVFDGVNTVHVPQSIEAVDGTAAVRKAVIEGFVSDMKGGRSPEVSLVRASAVAKGADPVAAETAFAAAQQAANVQAEVALGDALAAQPGGTV